eukprot:2441056-Heterocapsa_arctica.AAC.1
MFVYNKSFKARKQSINIYKIHQRLAPHASLRQAIVPLLRPVLRSVGLHDVASCAPQVHKAFK